MKLGTKGKLEVYHENHSPTSKFSSYSQNEARSMLIQHHINEALALIPDLKKELKAGGVSEKLMHDVFVMEEYLTLEINRLLKLDKNRIKRCPPI